MIQTKKQNTDPVAEPETGRPAGTGEEWQGRNRSNKRRLWERMRALFHDYALRSMQHLFAALLYGWQKTAPILVDSS